MQQRRVGRFLGAAVIGVWARCAKEDAARFEWSLLAPEPWLLLSFYVGARP